MLEALARFDIRFRWLIVAVWVVVAVARRRRVTAAAQNHQSVGIARTTARSRRPGA